jgi:hypothetical protein
MKYYVLSLLLMNIACARHDDRPDAGGSGVLIPDVQVIRASATIPAGPLVPGRTFGQTFISGGNGLTKVEVLIATYTKIIPQGVLLIRLRSGSDQTEDLAQVSVPAASVKDNSYFGLEFPPIRDSAGKTYYILIETRGIPPGYAFTVWRSDTDVYSPGSFYIDGRPQPQDICFRTFIR